MPLFLGEDKITRVIMSVESADGGTNTNDATLNSGAQMLQGVTAYSKGTKYTGTIPTVEGPTPDISVSSDGLIAASVSNPKGYQAGSTTKTATQQLTTKGATTITPSSASQIAVNSGVYTTGKITVSAVPTETKKITANGTYSPSAGKYFSSVEVAIAGDTPTYQSKTISPSTSVQTVTADSGYDALSDVTVNAIQTETKSVTSNGTYKPTSGKYFSSVTVNVPSETFNTQTKTVTPTESTQTISPDNGYNGLSTVTVNPISSTYIGSAVPTKGATTITPNSNSQIAISSGTYATGNITVSAVSTETKSITANGTYTPSNGKYFSSVNVNVVGDAFDTQSKSVTPTESEQIVTPDAGYDGLSSVTVGAISSTYVGSGVARKSAVTITPSTSAQTAVSAGTYVTGDIKVDTIPSNYIDTSDATAMDSDIINGVTAYVNGEKVTGSRRLCRNASDSGATITNTYLEVNGIGQNYHSENYGEANLEVKFLKNCYANADDITAIGITIGTASASDVISGKTFSSIYGLDVTGTMPSKEAATITPNTTDQTIAAGQYLTGAQTIKGDGNLVPENIISGKSIFGVSGSVVIQKYYTGASDPSSSLGNDGDIYLKA